MFYAWKLLVILAVVIAIIVVAFLAAFCMVANLSPVVCFGLFWLFGWLLALMPLSVLLFLCFLSLSHSFSLCLSFSLLRHKANNRVVNHFLISGQSKPQQKDGQQLQRELELKLKNSNSNLNWNWNWTSTEPLRWRLHLHLCLHLCLWQGFVARHSNWVGRYR